MTIAEGSYAEPTIVGAGELKASFSYDGAGRQTRQVDWLGNGADAGYDRRILYYASGQVASETTYTKQGSDTWKSVASNAYGTGAAYALGAIIASSTSDYKAAIQRRRNISPSLMWAWGITLFPEGPVYIQL